MITVYVVLVKNNKRHLEEVPQSLKDGVIAALIDEYNKIKDDEQLVAQNQNWIDQLEPHLEEK